MKGREFLVVREHLAAFGDEASKRSRIGRAYYAAYIEARQTCEQRFGWVRDKSGREHSQVSRMLGEIDQQMSVNLTFLRQLRNIADYEMDTDISTIELQMLDALALATTIVDRLDALQPVPTEPVDPEPDTTPVE